MSNKLQFDISRRVLCPQLNHELCTRGARQQNSMICVGDVAHTNPYVALEQAISIFMHTLAHKEKVLMTLLNESVKNESGMMECGRGIC